MFFRKEPFVGTVGLMAILALSVPAEIKAQQRVDAGATGEVGLVVASKGVSKVPAECATIRVTVRGTGPTLADARLKTKAIVEQLTSDLTKQGIPSANLGVEEVTTQLGFISGDAPRAEMPLELQGVVAQRSKSATSVITMSIMDLTLLPRVRDILRDRESVFVEGPQFALKDDRSARRAAITDAVNRARVDAEAYALALGMKVTRVANVRDLAADASLMQDYE